MARVEFGDLVMHCALTVLNERGAYLEVHGGTGMGGSVAYVEHPSSLNVVSDLICEAASTLQDVYGTDECSCKPARQRSPGHSTTQHARPTYAFQFVAMLGQFKQANHSP